MIRFLFDSTGKHVGPFYTPEVIISLLELNWNQGERDLADFCEKLLNSLPEQDRTKYSSEIRYIVNKKLRTSRELLAAKLLNTKLNFKLVEEIGQPCWVMVNCLDHGFDAAIVDENHNILRYIELKSTKAALTVAKRKNNRGDAAGKITATYSSTFKFHLNKTDDHARNLATLKKNLRKDTSCVFLYTMCFEKGINGVVDGFFLTGKNCASILDKLGKKNNLLKQISPSACYGKYKKKIGFTYTKDLNKDRTNKK